MSWDCPLHRFCGPRATTGGGLAYLGSHLLGIIGYGLLREYEVVIDYPHRRVSFYSLYAGAGAAARPFVRRDSLAFALVRGFPIATGYLGKVLAPLLLDTGAAANQLNAALCQALAPDARPVLNGTERNTGADGHHQLTQRGTLPRLLLDSNTWHDLPVPLVQPADRALAYQGPLGYSFLRLRPAAVLQPYPKAAMNFYAFR